MNEVNNVNIIKEKKTQLLNALDDLSITILNKIKSKNEEILNAQNTIKPDLDYLAKYKTEKNKEFDQLKSELNDIVNNIDNVIKNITNE